MRFERVTLALAGAGCLLFGAAAAWQAQHGDPWVGLGALSAGFALLMGIRWTVERASAPQTSEQPIEVEMTSERALALVTAALQEMSCSEVEYDSVDNGWVAWVRTGRSRGSFGELLSVTATVSGDNVRLFIESSLRRFQVTDYGKNKRNVQQLRILLLRRAAAP